MIVTCNYMYKQEYMTDELRIIRAETNICFIQIYVRISTIKMF